VTKHYVEGQRLGLPPGTVACYLASEVNAEIDFLKGELKAVETKAGIENIIEQAKAQERAECDAEIEALRETVVFAQDTLKKANADVERYAQERDAAKAEVEKLRKQLAWVAIGPAGPVL